ncbi:MAG: ankyrin repeat domain-containing protein [Pirellulales bacterium]
MTKEAASLYRAARRGDYNAVRALLSAGADVNLRGDRGSTPLHGALGCYSRAREQIVRALIKAGAAVDSRDEFFGWMPLHMAVWVDSLGAVDQLLRAGAQVDAVDDKGRTPLLIACSLFPSLEEWRKAERIAARLVRAGANVNARSGDTAAPLHEAALAGQMRTVRLLLSRNVPVNVRDNTGRTPLHYAVLGEEPAIAKILVEHGAWRNARDNRGQTPDEAAKEPAEGLVIEKAKRSGMPKRRRRC